MLKGEIAKKNQTKKMKGKKIAIKIED